MAKKAGSENALEGETVQAFLDRFEGMEDQAVEIMTKAMAACKNGPRQDQKDLRAEMKAAGVRMATFNAMWALRQEQRKATRKVDELEEDDRDQLRQFATSMKGTPMGDLIQQRLDDVAF